MELMELMELTWCDAHALPPARAVPPGNALLAFGLRLSDMVVGLV
jgi:hypothetical protein